VIRNDIPSRLSRQRPVQLVLALCFHCMHHAHTKNVQIRGVPDKTHAVLRRRAAEAGMSMQEYLLSILNDLASRPTVAEVLARAGGRSGGRVGLEGAAEHLRAERDRR
jgi:plasmid stability protein